MRKCRTCHKEPPVKTELEGYSVECCGVKTQMRETEFEAAMEWETMP